MLLKAVARAAESMIGESNFDLVRLFEVIASAAKAMVLDTCGRMVLLEVVAVAATFKVCDT